MAELRDVLAGATYVNPVYDRSCPDPFVLKFAGEYWAYCTDFWRDGRVFGVLHSRDLVNWRELNGAMEPLPEGTLAVPQTCYWAPEVVYHNGLFLMYYSVGNEERMEIRVATATHPGGPFRDAGRRLTSEEFAIDAHVFADTDGARYLFYATDFLRHTHVGTGTVVDRMLDPFTLEGRPRPVTRALYDWQVYDPARVSKGGVRWHTVEGPAVLKHKGRYYEMFSGGNWQNTTYGVSYATTEQIDEPGEWSQVADGVQVLPVLRTLPGKVVGPGHNSVVRGPDNRQLFCVYHYWAEQGRVLAIDRLDWAGERLLVLGPTTTPQLAPLLPSFSDFFDGGREAGPGPGWETAGGRWVVHEGEAVQETEDEAHASLHCTPFAPHFIAEVSLRAPEGAGGRGALGVELLDERGASVFQFVLEPHARRAGVRTSEGRELAPLSAVAELPGDFAADAFHLLRLEVDEGRVRVTLDEASYSWEGNSGGRASRLGLFTERMSAAFKGFALTVGWEDLFTGPARAAGDAGWSDVGGGGEWRLDAGELHFSPAAGGAGVMTKGAPLESYEWVVSARFDAGEGDAGGYGFYPAYADEDAGPLLLLARRDAGWVLRVAEGGRGEDFPLPASFEPGIHQHFRFIKRAGLLAMQWEGEVLGVLETGRRATKIALFARAAKVSFDLVRVTMIKGE